MPPSDARAGDVAPDDTPGDAPVAVLASGSGTNLQAILDAQEQGRIAGRVAVVVSDREDAGALDRAKRHGADAVFVDPEGRSREDHEAEVGDVLDDHGARLVVLAGYLRILTPAFVDRFRWRIVNVHPALLPLFGGPGYYGLKVHQAVLDAGCRFSGATTHFVTEEVDAGPIILQAAVPVKEGDTAHTLQRRVLKVEHEVLPRTVDLFCRGRLEVVDDGARVRIREGGEGGGDAWRPDDQPDAFYSDGF